MKKTFLSIINPMCLVCINLIFLSCLVFGCGKKEMPLPPLKDTPESPFGLNTTHDGKGGLIIKWTHVSGHGSNSNHQVIKGFELFVAERDISVGKCRGCPLEFHKIASVPSSVFEYNYFVVKGYQYFIRLRAFSDPGVFSPWSETIEFDYQ